MQVGQLTGGRHLPGVKPLPVPVYPRPDLLYVSLGLGLLSLVVAFPGGKAGDRIAQLRVPLLQLRYLLVFGQCPPAVLDPAKLGVQPGQLEQPELRFGGCFNGVTLAGRAPLCRTQAASRGPDSASRPGFGRGDQVGRGCDRNWGMRTPVASRPHMPGYGLLGSGEGTGLLPWSWADERLSAARNYWVSTVRPDGRPHSMPVWGTWDADLLWFTSSVRSRRVRNLLAEPRCVATTEDASDPVVIDGAAEVITDAGLIGRVLCLMNAKYGTDIQMEFLDPAVNATIRLRPDVVIGLRHDDFTGSPTRWTFGERPTGAPA